MAVLAGSAAIIMAAGAGRRMGTRPKALLRRDGQYLLLRQIRLAQAAGMQRVVVVLGHHAAQLQAVLQAQLSEGVAAAVNPQPDAGPASSLRCGLLALPEQTQHIMVLLGDQPLLELADVQAVLHAWPQRPAGTALVVPVHDGQPGHPLVLGSVLRQTLLQAAAPLGLRQWRQQHPAQVLCLEAAHARYTTDVDSPEDVARLAVEYDVQLQW